jgi:hypothetical protein
VSTDRRIALLLDVFDQAFDRRAWHGTALWGSVRARFPAARLAARGWRTTWTNAQHVYGIASHDLYHAGQIQLLKALKGR